MRITGSHIFEKFALKHAGTDRSLTDWSNRIRAASFRNFAELRGTFGSADVVGPLTIFDIKGNRYRLIAHVDFARQACHILEVLTHDNYDRRKWMKHTVKESLWTGWPEIRPRTSVSPLTCQADHAFAISVLEYIGWQGATDPEHPQNTLFGLLFDVIHDYEQTHCPFP